jgi:hypothetical protein
MNAGVSPIYNRDLDFTRYNVPFLLHPYISFYTTPGLSCQMHILSLAADFDGHPWRQRSPQDVANEVEYALKTFKGLKEIFFDDDTFTIRKDRILAMCKVFKPLKFTWSCTSRVHVDYETLRAMKDAGCRLFIVGFESANDQILKNIKKGATAERGRKFAKDCKRAGIRVHGDFIIGLPGETRKPFRDNQVRQGARLRNNPGFSGSRVLQALSFTAIFSRTTSSPK